MTSWEISMTCCLSEVNKQEELEVCVQLQSSELIGIMQTWWDSSHDWSAVVDGYRLLRKDRLGQQEAITLYMGQQEGACLRMNNELVRADGSGLVGRPTWVTLR